MVARLEVPAGTRWADLLSYSRAVRIGDVVMVSGTLPVDSDGRPVGEGDAYRQAQCVFALVFKALEEAGARPGDVTRIRIYLQDYADVDAIARAQREAFGTVRPACTVLRAGLVDPVFRVQVDADAVIGPRDA